MNKSTVLIIDFDPDSLSSLTDFVRDEGFEVITARDGLTGWDIFRARHPDLVIMEAMLPKMNGFELCKKIVSDSRGATPVIMITGVYREISYRIEALQIYGASAFYSKPWNREDLKQRIFQLLNMNGSSHARKMEHAKTSAPVAPAPRAATGAAPAVEPAKLSPPEPNPTIGATMINNANETQAPAKAPEKKVPVKDKKFSLDREIEGMLKDTLAGLGLGTEKKKPASKIEIPGGDKPEARRTESPRPETSLTELPWVETLKAEKLHAEISLMETPRVKKPKAEAPKAEAHMVEKPVIEAPKVEKPVFQAPPVEKPLIEKSASTGAEFIEVDKEGKRPGTHLDISESKAFKETKETKHIQDAHKEKFGKEKAAEAVFPVTADKVRERVLDTPEPASRSKVAFDVFMETKKKPAPLMIGGLVLGFFLVSGTFYLVLKPKKAQIQLVDTAVATDTVVAGDSNPSSTEPEQTSQALAERLNAQIPAGVEAKPAPKKKAPEKPAAVIQADPETAPILDAASQLKLNEPAAKNTDATEAKANETAANAGAAVNPPAQDPKPADNQLKTQAESAVPAVKPGDLVAYTEIDVVPQIIKRTEAAYPEMARRMGAEGSILLNVLISETGSVIRTEILKGMINSFGLEKAAEDAAKQWKFSPAQKAGVPVKVWKAIEVVFRKDQ